MVLRDVRGVILCVVCYFVLMDLDMDWVSNMTVYVLTSVTYVTIWQTLALVTQHWSVIFTIWRYDFSQFWPLDKAEYETCIIPIISLFMVKTNNTFNLIRSIDQYLLNLYIVHLLCFSHAWIVLLVTVLLFHNDTYNQFSSFASSPHGLVLSSAL